MEVNCAGCAGWCIDWRPLGAEPENHERRGIHTPLDDVYNFVPLSRDEIRSILEANITDALIPRVWLDESDDYEEGRVTWIDDYPVAAIEGNPVFFIGLRKPPKPVAPFGGAPVWLPTCIFLDPSTLQCRLYDSDLYPDECADYPGHNLELGAETECERVESAFGGTRLIDSSPPDSVSPMLLGPQAIGQKVFVHPQTHRLDGVISRLDTGTLQVQDRAEFIAAAAAGSPGTTAVNMEEFDRVYEQVIEARSWIGPAIDEWIRLAETADPDPRLGSRVEEDRGAKPTPGWE